MYRILKRFAQLATRYQTAPRVYAAPELLATGPNQVWSWDITKLKGPRKWTYYYLYVLLDIFSRFVVGWMVAERELGSLARELICATLLDQGIGPDELTVHSDRGGPMRSLPVAQLYADLGITKSLSRPYCSNDNPYSEATFKTLKYRPGFPERFESLLHAKTVCRELFHWYNHEHRHSGIAMLTPASVHYGLHESILQQRASVMADAYRLHPERFVRGVPTIMALPHEVWINKPNLSSQIVVLSPAVSLSQLRRS